MQNRDFRFRYLVTSFFRGKTSEAEDAELFSLIEKDKQKKVDLQEYEAQFTSYDSMTDEAWWSLRRKMVGRMPQKNFAKIRIKLFTLLRYAAVFFLSIISFQLWKDNSSSPVEYCTLVVPKGQKSQLILPDGSTVLLNSSSTLRYPSNFSKTQRSVEFKGEAYFKVAHDSEHPFSVKTVSYTVMVHGTEFNMSTFNDAGVTETTLIKGAISLIDSASKREYTLKSGEKITYNVKAKSYTIAKGDLENTSAWTKDVLSFDNLPIKELYLKLSRWYDIEIINKAPSFDTIRYSGKFKNKESLWQVLEAVKATTPIEYTFKNRILTIYKGKRPMKQPQS